MYEYIDAGDVVASPHRSEYEAFLQLDRFVEGKDFDPDKGLYRLIRTLSLNTAFSQMPEKNIRLFPLPGSRKPLTQASVKALFEDFIGTGGKIYIASRNVSLPQQSFIVRAGEPITEDSFRTLLDYNLKCTEEPGLKPVTQVSILDLLNEDEARGLQEVLDDLRGRGTPFRPSLLKRQVHISCECTGYSLRFPWQETGSADYPAQLRLYEQRCRWEEGRLRVKVCGKFKISREASLVFDGQSIATSSLFRTEVELLFGYFPLFSSRGTIIYNGVERVPVLHLVRREREAKRGEKKKAEPLGLDALVVRTFLDDVRAVVMEKLPVAVRGLKRTLGAHGPLTALDLKTAPGFDERFDELIKSECTRLFNDVNPLAEVSQKREITLRGPGGIAGEHVAWGQRGVHWTHVGRICITETPESRDIGLNLCLALAAGLRDGRLVAPYVKPDETGESKETQWLDPEEDKKHVLAPKHYLEYMREGKTLARKEGSEILAVCPKEITLQEKYRGQFLGLGASLIPFVQHDDNNRVMMGAKNAKQALPLKSPEEPIIQTGREELAARLSGHPVHARREGIVTEVTSERIVVTSDDDAAELYPLEAGRPTVHGALVCHRPRVKSGQKVATGDLLADGAATCNGRLTLGVNLLVAYMPYEGLNFEDGIVASDRLVKKNILTSLHMICERFEVYEGEHVVGPAGWEKDPEVVQDEALFELYARKGVYCQKDMHVRRGDKLFGKAIRENGKTVIRYCRAPENGKVVRVIHRSIDQTAGPDVCVEHDGDRGRYRPRVRFVKACWIQFERKLEVGDKLMGRHGNKGVVARILPEREMPALEDGTHVDLILNPHGVVSRMNLGQILETHWSWVLKKGDPEKYAGYSTVAPFETFPEEELKKALKDLASTGVDETGKFQLSALRDGGRKRFENRVVVGYQYFMKLNHLAANKVHARETGPHSLILEQPVKGKKAAGGQRFGEMEVWALESHLCPHLLRELLTVRSDEPSFLKDDLTREHWQKEIPLDETVPFTETFYATIMLLRGLCIDLVFVDADNDEVSLFDWKSGKTKAPIVKARIRFADAQLIESWAEGRSLTVPGIPRWKRDGWVYPKRGLFDPGIFNAKGQHSGSGDPTRENMAFIRLAVPVIHPLHLDKVLADIAFRLQAFPGGPLEANLPHRCLSALQYDGGPGPCENLLKCLSNTFTFQSLADRNGSFVPWDFLFYSCACGAVRGWRGFGLKVGATCPACGKKVARNRNADGYLNFPLRGGAEYLEDLAAALGLGLRKGALLAHVPVLPIDFRPLKARHGNASYRSDLNDYYKSILRINGKIEAIRDMQAQEAEKGGERSNWERPLLSLKKALQTAVTRLMVGDAVSRARKKKSIADRISGKEGILRQHLLGKRVNVSARTVIVPDPELKPDEVSVPYGILERLLKSKCREELALRMSKGSGVANEEEARRILAEKGPNRKMVEALLDSRKKGSLLNDVCAVLNRSPSLHKYSVLSFKPVPKRQNVIGLHPLACRFFNADFDGDTMALFLPLFKETHQEARERLAATKNVLSTANGDILYHFDQDIVLGIYLFTCTKEGRDKFSSWFQYAPDVTGKPPEIDAPVTGEFLKHLVLSYHQALLDKLNREGRAHLACERTAVLAQKIMEVGFQEATRWGITLSIFDIPSSRQNSPGPCPGDVAASVTDDPAGQQLVQQALGDPEFFRRMLEEKSWAGKMTPERLKEWMREHGDPEKAGGEVERINPLALMFQSGARSNLKQMTQLGCLRGPLQDIDGRDIGPEVEGNFREGVSPLEYYLGSHAARRTMCEKKLSVAPAGALTRMLVEATYPIVVKMDDCGTQDSVTFAPFPPFLPAPDKGSPGLKLPPLNKRLMGRSLSNGEIIAADLMKTLEENGTSLQIRSVLTCKALEKHGYGAVCQKCYGWDLSRMDYPEIGAPVGIWASQSIGERGTQLSMRTFHTGGGGGEGAITGGLQFMRRLFGCTRLNPLMYKVLNSSSSKWSPGQEITVWEYLCSMVRGEALPTLGTLDEPERRIAYDMRKVVTNWGVDVARTVLAFEGYRIYGGAIDERHFEVVLKAMILPGEEKPASIKMVPFFHLRDRSFLAQAAYQRGIQVLTEAALEEKEDQLELYKTRIMVGALFKEPESTA